MILLTGATGYIGSHTWVELINAGYDVVGVDNFSNSSPLVINRLKDMLGSPLNFECGDVRDKIFLQELFKKYSISGVIHFAAKKSVAESVSNPLDYYDVNIGGLVNLLQVMIENRCLNFVFSSSATVYGNPKRLPIFEIDDLCSANPYGRTKLFSEEVINDLVATAAGFNAAILRYFNPVGAHVSGLIGEDPMGVPNNLMPYIAQVAVGRREFLNVYGNDWPTIDGTGVRDYIHVCDLAVGHVQSIDYLLNNKKSFVVNLGRGHGSSVLEVVRAFETVSNTQIPIKFAPRRDGDVASSYANTDLANQLLGWRASRDLLEMCADTWRWQINNPNGY